MDAERFDHLTRALGSRVSRRTALAAGLSGIGAIRQGGTAAQDATPAPGAIPAAEGDNPVFMFVQTATSGRGEINPAAGTPTADGTPVPGGGASFLLTLEGHSGQTIYFSDRPDRVAGAIPTEDFLNGLGFSPANPPNAALVAEFDAGQGVVVLELLAPTYDPVTGLLTYGAEGIGAFAGERLESVTRDQIAERLPAAFGPAALFIDDCPSYTSCSADVWAMFNGHPVFIGVEVIGPIPGGPYPACFNPETATCEPCTTSLDELAELCRTAYPEFCSLNGDPYCVPT
jgi:hypothetical protein